MYYKQVTNHCFGQGLLEEADINQLRQESAQILKTLLKESEEGKLPIIALSKETKDLQEIEAFAENIAKNFDHLVVLGTGGSTLCGHTVAGLRQSCFSAQKVIFMQNIDPHSFSALFDAIDVSKTAFLVISKSGVSVETLVQFLVSMGRSDKLDISKQFFSICVKKENILRNISSQYKIQTYEHAEDVGGRFSILSLVGLMPGKVAGVDIRKLRSGAAKFLNEHADLAAESAAIHVALMRKGFWINVMMTYPDALEDLNIWYRQIWAESIGKNGTGSTPIKAMGTIDQHSQMQLYLAGRKDKFFNFVTLKYKDSNFVIKSSAHPDLAYLKGKSLGDVINAEQQATIETLVQNKRPVRVIELEKLDEETFGMLIMHLMLETIITGKLLGVNPYDQPAVEDGKIKTRKILGG